MNSNNEGSDQFRTGIDKVGASKAGHAYHEAWAARSTLELLNPTTDLVAIALEGFTAEDEVDLDSGAVEIADMTRYYGAGEVANATRVNIVQFKYSIANSDQPIRAATLAATLAKFAATDAQLRKRHGDELVDRVVKYEFVTNRPRHPNLVDAIARAIDGAKASGDVEKQRRQLLKAIEDYPFPAYEFFRRLDVIGGGGSLAEANQLVARTLASWGEARDPESEMRLLKLRAMVREKAGLGEKHDKRIVRVTVLAELGLDDEHALYPTPDAFPQVEHIIEREALAEAAASAQSGSLPLVIHGAGGMGKTVLMQGLAVRFAKSNRVVVFDGFGAGQWRDLADGRHRPQRTLLHLANILAGYGLCDILLPIADETSLLRAFRRRLTQAVEATRRQSAGSGIVLMLDAIDHAAISAEYTRSSSFAHLILNTLSVDPIDGVRVIASCRSERRLQAVGGAAHRCFEVPPFSHAEARGLIKLKAPDATIVDATALIARSGRNPRCLAELLNEGRPYDVEAGPDASPATVLDSLLLQRIDRARENARLRGATDEDINLLLAGLALLPPPVPFEELAATHGVTAAQVESFAADLSPLLERTSNADRTSYGLMFRDEPTETLIVKMTAVDVASRRRVLDALAERQSHSNYAARAFPAILTALGETDRLIALAYDTRVPVGTSKVGQRDIRISRLTSAIEMTAKSSRRDDLFGLLLEASTVAAGHERSDRFLYEFPDLAAISGDDEALRRLNATKCGWAGGKHAALGIAYILRGETDEARRNARRAIAWHNWRVNKQDDERVVRTRVSTELDETGFAYIEMLAGNEEPIAKYFARKSEENAYSAFSQLFDLFERDRGDAISLDLPFDRLLTCRLRSRAFWTAAIRFSRRDDSADRTFVSRLAAAIAKTRAPDVLLMRIASGVSRALQLGMKAEALAILDGAIAEPPALYDFSNQWGSRSKRAATAIVIASLRATIARRPVGLIDIAPKELREILAPSVLKRGATAFANAVMAKLTDPKPTGRIARRVRRSPEESEARRELKSTLTHRIEPMIPLSQAIANMIQPPSQRSGSEMLGEALDLLAKRVDAASDYPFRDGKSYAAREGFTAVFEVADALGLIDRPHADRIAAWLAAAPGFNTAHLTEVVQRLSRTKSCQTAALTLAGHVERRIQKDTDISSRISSYGELARAVWRVSRDDAAAYFRRTLDLADAVGSEDYVRTNHLLELAGNYKGPVISGKASHALTRTLEMNQGDDDRFPWWEFARAVAPAAGLGILPVISRLDDRKAADLKYSLGPSLTTLVSSGRLSGKLALCLFGLAVPGETYVWRISHFAEQVMQYLSPTEFEQAFGFLLVEIDRDDQLDPSSETIRELRDLAQRYLKPPSAALERLTALTDRKVERDGDDRPRSSQPSVTSSDVPILDPDEIDRAILHTKKEKHERLTARRVLSELIPRLTNPSDRLRFVSAVVAARVPRLSDKLYALEDELAGWAALSPAFHDALPALGLQLARSHAQELVRHAQEDYVGWRVLQKGFRCSHADLVEQAIISLHGVAAEIGGDSWLRLAAKVSPFVRTESFSEGYTRFLEASGDTIPAEVGDGPWEERFSASAEQAEIAAGLIWMRLGHPSAAARWRAAHAILRLDVMNQSDVIDRLVERFTVDTASPFCDLKLPFYPMHARLWLLIALARLAKSNPPLVGRYRALLEEVACSTSFPHVAMRAFAGRALGAVASTLEATEEAKTLVRVAAINASAFPRLKSKHRPSSGRHVDRPKGSPEPENSFHVDYDFNKHQTDGACRAFALAGWEVKDAMTAWVRQWDRDVQGMYVCPRKIAYDDYGTSGSSPTEDRYGGYLAWHAFMLTVGELIHTRPVVAPEWDEDPLAGLLDEHLLSRSDGHWLADATDLFPLDLPRSSDLAMPDKDSHHAAISDKDLLLPWVGISNEQHVADWIPVHGDWTIVRHLNVHMRSVLANGLDAEAVAMAWLSEEQIHRWLPNSESDVARHVRGGRHSVRYWIDADDHTNRYLDRNDPYCCSQALGRATPAPWVQEQLNVRPDDWCPRSWSGQSGTIFRAEAWGAAGGRGEHAWDIGGDRLRISRAGLFDLLARTGLIFVGAFNSRKYTPTPYGQREKDTSSFSHRSVIFTLDAKGAVRVPTALSKKARLALASLGREDRRDFDARFGAIKSALKS